MVGFEWCNLGLNQLMEDIMPLWFIVALAAVPYLAFGFFFGIFREWAGQAITSKCYNLDLQGFAANVMFPLSMIARNEKDPDERPFLLDGTGGGFLYWNTVAIVWPILIVHMIISVIVHTVLALIQGSAYVLASPSRFCKTGETRIRQRFDIKK